jgi:hypothetical protein
MTVDEARFRARRELEHLGLSMESASYLVDDRPPDGWGSLVTKAELRAEMAELRADMQREFKLQTWRLLTAVFVAFGLFVTIARLT